MYKVLIAEDEMLVRIGIKNSIDWTGMGMKVVADVPNGKAALEFYRKEKPDIILTDIKMPEMDGIRLISKIRETDDKTKIVILTCYEEFDLIHNALKLGVSDYILKLKMSTDEMEQVLRKILSQLRETEADSDLTADITQNESGEISATSLFHEQIYFERYTEEEFEAAADKSGLRLGPERLIMAVMTIDESLFHRTEKAGSRGNRTGNMLADMINSTLESNGRGEAVQMQSDRYMVVFSFNDIENDECVDRTLFAILARIDKLTKGYANAVTAFGISDMYDGYVHLAKMYRECLKALEYSYFVSSSKYLRYADIRKTIQFHTETADLSPKIAKAVSYIKENYRSDISIEKIAEKLDISPNYLGTLFKKELELTFVEYVNHVRINRAKDLFLGTHLKTYEVAEQVGFKDVSYFSRIFKKITSLRPGEFRRKCITGAAEDFGHAHER